MGQRSQIYVAYTLKGNYGEEDKTYLTAIYFQWNYGSRMVSRVKGLAEWLQDNWYALKIKADKIPLVASVNFDLRDIVDTSDLLEEREGEDIDVFSEPGNNDGKGFISVSAEGAVKYCFTDSDATAPMTAEEYMAWEEITDTEEKCGSNYSVNCKYLSQIPLMTEEDLDAFIHRSYENYSQKTETEVPMQRVGVQAYPYASQWGEINVPLGLDDEETREYINKNWNKIEFSDADLDYKGTDFELYFDV